MQVIISHETALQLYRSARWIPRLLRLIEQDRYTSSVWPVGPASRTKTEAVAGALGLDLPLDTLVADARARRQSRAQHAHVWQGELPDRALLRISDEIFVVSPAFLLLLLSRGKPFERTLMIGEELAGHFAIDAASPSNLIRRPPLLSRQGLASFLQGCPGTPGIRLATKVARHLLGNARSPKEAELGQLLHLPRTLGGRGIDGVELNRRIELEATGRILAGRDHLESDVFLPFCATGYEYDSNDHHLTREQHESDERKRNAYKTAGVDLLVVTSGQLHAWCLIDELLGQAERAYHGARRPSSDEMRAKQYELWRRLILQPHHRG